VAPVPAAPVPVAPVPAAAVVVSVAKRKEIPVASKEDKWQRSERWQREEKEGNEESLNESSEADQRKLLLFEAFLVWVCRELHETSLRSRPWDDGCSDESDTWHQHREREREMEREMEGRDSRDRRQEPRKTEQRGEALLGGEEKVRRGEAREREREGDKRFLSHLPPPLQFPLRLSGGKRLTVVRRRRHVSCIRICRTSKSWWRVCESALGSVAAVSLWVSFLSYEPSHRKSIFPTSSSPLSSSAETAEQSRAEQSREEGEGEEREREEEEGRRSGKGNGDRERGEESLPVGGCQWSSWDTSLSTSQ
jgi:hypothetical protein